MYGQLLAHILFTAKPCRDGAISTSSAGSAAGLLLHDNKNVCQLCLGSRKVAGVRGVAGRQRSCKRSGLRTAACNWGAAAAEAQAWPPRNAAGAPRRAAPAEGVPTRSTQPLSKAGSLEWHWHRTSRRCNAALRRGVVHADSCSAPCLRTARPLRYLRNGACMLL